MAVGDVNFRSVSALGKLLEMFMNFYETGVSAFATSGDVFPGVTRVGRVMVRCKSSCGEIEPICFAIHGTPSKLCSIVLEK
jgi:hypothetical protein